MRDCVFAQNNRALGLRRKRNPFRQHGSALSVILTIAGFPFLFNDIAIAQIIPDNTLPRNTIVTEEGNTSIITGGTQIGSNLFHSFEEFSILTGQEAFFDRALEIENILTRVTGRNISNIDGLIRVGGTANLFLLNPNGIVFGPNAQLNIGGSFVATTANSFLFANGSTFSASDPQAPALLTVNVPVGLQYGQIPGNIINRSSATDSNGQSVGMQVTPGQTLGLIGGNVTLEGGKLRSPAGRIEIGSVGENSRVAIAPTETGFAFEYDGVQNFQDIQLLQQSEVSTGGESGGSIQLQGRQVSVTDGSRVLAITEGSQAGGNIRIQGTQRVQVSGTNPDNFTAIASDTTGAGAGGDLTIETGQFLLQGTALLSAATFGAGPGGNLTIRATDAIVAIGTGFDSLELFLGGALSGQLQPSDRIGGLFTGTAGIAPGGDMSIETAGSLRMLNGAIAFSPTFGKASGGQINIQAGDGVEAIASGIFSTTAIGSQGSAGNLSIDTNRLIVRDGSVISSATLGNGAGGDIKIQAFESVEVIQSIPGNLLPTGILNNTLFGTGPGGDIQIKTGRLINREGALIVANSGGNIRTGTITSGGPGGNIEIEASESIEIAGFSADGLVTSGPGTTTLSDTAAGDLTLSTRKLTIADGAIVSSATLGAGQGGTLTVNASESVEIVGTSAITGLPTTLVASSGRADLPELQATGAGGDVRINTGTLIVRDGATLDVRSFGSGRAGNLDIVADAIRLDRGGTLNAATVSGAGGNIQMRSPDILLRQGSNITTNAGNTDGGNITIDTDNLVALDNSDITANALEGRGGRVSISAEGIFGTQFRQEVTSQSDITATSELGPEFSGTVELNTPDTDSSLGIVELEENVVDVTKLIAQNFCEEGTGSEFTVTGRGGVPSSPTDVLNPSLVLDDLRVVETTGSHTGGRSSQPSTIEPKPLTREKTLIEAQGWVVDADGTVMLVAEPVEVTPQSSWMTRSHCR